MALRYYLYISDSKIDMLLQQIEPGARRKLASEFGLDIKVLTAKRKAEHTVGDERVGRLEVVTKWIEEHADLGSSDEPGAYFSDVLTMRWGPFLQDPDRGLVYFGGSTDRTIVGLGGSSKHLIGAPVSGTVGPGHSATPFLLSELQNDLDEGPRERYSSDSLTLQDEDSEGMALAAVHMATTGMKGPRQTLEFMARKLLKGPSPYPDEDRKPTNVLLGSPLYVALVD